MISERGKNRTVLVTGASRGIGRAIAVRFANERYHVIATDLERESSAMRDLQESVTAAGGKLDIVYGDVTDVQSVENNITAALQLSDKIDVLVHNAGALALNRIESISPEEWDLIYSVNAKGTFLVNKSILAHFRRNRAGRIVNIASIGGKLGATSQAHYCSAKASVIRFTQILAQEVAEDGITVNAICPGVVDTEMGRNNYRDDASLMNVLKRTALGRLGSPDDIVGSVAFFASDDAAFITGQSLNVCGGMIFH